MMLDEDLIENALVGVVKDLVGAKLATITNPSGTTPAVIKARSNGPRPDLPYITVDVNNFIQPSGWLLHKYFDGSDQLNYEFLYEMFVDFKCFGDQSKDIMREFRAYLSIPELSDKFKTDVFGASVQNVGSVLNTPDILSTDFEEGATLTVSFYIIDTLTNPEQEGDYILDINGNGDLKTSVNGDVSVDIDVSAPTPP